MGWEDVELSEDEKPRRREYVEGTCLVQQPSCKPCPNICPIEAKCHAPPQDGPYYIQRDNEPGVIIQAQPPQPMTMNVIMPSVQVE